MEEINETDRIRASGMDKQPTVSIGIPAYNRPAELDMAMHSILEQTLVPAEVTICEDKSPQREDIRRVMETWTPRLAEKGIVVNYIENPVNLGYDGNLRRVIEKSTSEWVILLGNDDLLLPEAVKVVSEYVARNGVMFISRAFVRFRNSLDSPLGTSRLSSADRIYTSADSDPAVTFKACRFVGGLIVNREWAKSVATDVYDGTLYYQFYLSALAFFGQGIGYVATPIAAGRTGNPPLFGTAAKEARQHTPGRYSPTARAAMWQGVLRISDEVGTKVKRDLLGPIRHELMSRESFHVFEMMAGESREDNRKLRNELKRLGLFSHPLPRLFYSMNQTLGAYSHFVYSMVRRIYQQ